MSDYWEGAAGALLGAFVGSCVPLAWAAYQRQYERTGELTAMAVELMHARRNLAAIKAAEIQNPTYQLPLNATHRALPKLIGEGLLNDNETSALIEYVMKAEELNRALDRAGAASVSNIQPSIVTETNRTRATVTEILEYTQQSLGGQTLLDAAEAAVYRLMDIKTRRARVYEFLFGT